MSQSKALDSKALDSKAFDSKTFEGPPLLVALRGWGPQPEIETTALMQELCEFASAEGFCYSYINLSEIDPADCTSADCTDADGTRREESAARSLLDQVHAANPAVTRRRFVQEDFVRARDIGWGGHPPAREYWRQLLEFAPNPYEWPEEAFPAAGLILGQCRHLFFLAQQARWSKPMDPEHEEFYRSGQLYHAARTLVSGPMYNASGAQVEIPEAALFAPEDFPEMDWPRYSEHATDDGEAWIIQHEEPLDQGSFWDSQGERFRCNHRFEFFWDGVVPSSFITEKQSIENQPKDNLS